MSKGVNFILMFIVLASFRPSLCRPPPDQKVEPPTLETLKEVVSELPIAKDFVSMDEVNPLTSTAEEKTLQGSEENVKAKGAEQKEVPDEDTRLRADFSAAFEENPQPSMFKREIRVPHMIDFITAGGESWSPARPIFDERRFFEDERAFSKRQTMQPVAFPFRFGGVGGTGFTGFSSSATGFPGAATFSGATGFPGVSQGISTGLSSMGSQGLSSFLPQNGATFPSLFQQQQPQFFTQPQQQHSSAAFPSQQTFQQQPQFFAQPQSQLFMSPNQQQFQFPQSNQQQFQFPQSNQQQIQFPQTNHQFPQSGQQFASQPQQHSFSSQAVPNFQQFQQPMQFGQPMGFAQPQFMPNPTSAQPSQGNTQGFTQSTPKPQSFQSAVKNTTASHVNTRQAMPRIDIKPQRPSFLMGSPRSSDGLEARSLGADDEHIDDATVEVDHDHGMTETK